MDQIKDMTCNFIMIYSIGKNRSNTIYNKNVTDTSGSKSNKYLYYSNLKKLFFFFPKWSILNLSVEPPAQTILQNAN